MLKTYYIRSREYGHIVNAVMTSKPKDEILVPGNDDLYLDENPPLNVLQDYEFWTTRP